MVGRVGVGAKSGQPKAWKLQHGRDDLHGLLGGHTKPLEPDVELDEDVAWSTGRLRVGSGAFEVYEGRDEAVSDGFRRRLRERVGIDQNRGCDPALAQAKTLGQIGDGQRIGAVRDEVGT